MPHPAAAAVRPPKAGGRTPSLRSLSCGRGGCAALLAWFSPSPGHLPLGPAWSGGPRVVQLNRSREHASLPDNTVRNTKYTAASFLPQLAVEQFSIPMNLYFLIVACLQLWSTITPVNPLTTWAPLIAVFTLSGMREALDDWKRRKADAAANSRAYTVYKQGERLPACPAKSIQVGDLVLVHDEEEVPCDLLLLRTGGADGKGFAFVQTASLDGETDLKSRSAVAATQRLGSNDAVAQVTGTLKCEAPNAELYRFDAELRLDAQGAHAAAGCHVSSAAASSSNSNATTGVAAGLQTSAAVTPTSAASVTDSSHYGSRSADATTPASISISDVHLLQAGTVVKKSVHVLGLAVYTGPHTKLHQSRRTPLRKVSALDAVINRFTVYIFLAQVVLVLVLGVLSVLMASDDAPDSTFLSIPAVPSALPPPPSLPDTGDTHFTPFTDDASRAHESSSTGVATTGDRSSLALDAARRLLDVAFRDTGETLADVGSGTVPAPGSSLMDSMPAAWQLWLILPLRFMLLSSMMIPISLKVTLDGARTLYAFWISRDPELYDATLRVGGSAPSSNTIEELGVVDTVLTDKTGTLTENNMRLRFVSVGGARYSLYPAADAAHHVLPTLADGLMSSRPGVADLMRALALCNSVEPQHTDAQPLPPARAAAADHSPSMHSGVGGRSSGSSTLLSPAVTALRRSSLSSSTAATATDGVAGVSSAWSSTSISSVARDRRRCVEFASASADEEALVAGVAEHGVCLFMRYKDADGCQTALLKFPHPDRAYMHSPILDFASQPLATSHSAASSSGSASSGGMPPSPSAVAATPSSVRSISVGSFPVNNSADARVPADLKHVWVEDTQPTSTYQVVHVLAFSSARKCMSVLVRCVEAHEVAARSSATGRSATPSPSALPEFVETQGQLLLLTKGADEVMLPKLAPSASPEADAALSHVKADLLHFAEAGLRTLLVASRVVPEAEYDAWRIMAHEASVAVEHRAELLEAAYARLERNLTPLGCTAIEDRLQAGVPEAIQTLRAAGVQVWMLTGDKAETATQIARAANLIPTAAASQLLPPYTTVQRGGDAGGYATDDDAVAPSCDMIGFDVGFEPAGVSTFLRNELPVRRGSDVSVGPTPSLYEFRIVATTERECASIIAAVQGQVNAAKRGTHSRSVAHGAASAADVTAPLPLLGALRADHSGRSDSDASLDGDAVSASSMERAVTRPRKVEDVATPSLSVRSRRMEGAATPLVSTLSLSASPLRGTVEGGNVTDVAIDVDRDVHITLVVEGIETLHHCLSAGLSSHFLRLATSCHTVLACRATPLQKAALAALVKQAGRRVLTIGDGGNDVPMIQEACVGVGVAGREGSAAVRAADFTLPSFAKLPHLLMVHGRQAHYRTALTAQYTFYKSMCVCGVQLGFNFMCHFSGCSLLDTFSLTTYNLLFTFLPGFMLVLDQHRSTYELLVVPEFYKESRAMSWFDCRTFLRWVLLAIFHTTVVVGGGLLLLSPASGLHGETLDQTSLSYAIFTALVITQLVVTLLSMQRPVGLNVLVNVGCAVLYAALLYVRDAWPASSSGLGVLSHVLTTQGVACFLLLVCVVNLMPLFVSGTQVTSPSDGGLRVPPRGRTSNAFRCAISLPASCLLWRVRTAHKLRTAGAQALRLRTISKDDDDADAERTQLLRGQSSAASSASTSAVNTGGAGAGGTGLSVIAYADAGVSTPPLSVLQTRTF